MRYIFSLAQFFRFKNTSDHSQNIDKAQTSYKPSNKLTHKRKDAYFQKPFINFSSRKYKIFTKQHNIDLYFQKYSNHKQYLDYDDFLQSILPQNDLKTISNHSQQINTLKDIFLMKQKLGNTLFNILALVMGTQINFIGNQYQNFKELQKINLQKSALLWHLLDTGHCNFVDYEIIKQVSRKYATQVSQAQWKCFLHWHFNHNKATMVRDDFMYILSNFYDKRERSSKYHSNQLQIQNQKRNILIHFHVDTLNLQNNIRQNLANIEVKEIKNKKEKHIVKKELDQFVNLQRIKDRQKLICKINESISKNQISNSFISTRNSFAVTPNKKNYHSKMQSYSSMQIQSTLMKTKLSNSTMFDTPIKRQNRASQRYSYSQNKIQLKSIEKLSPSKSASHSKKFLKNVDNPESSKNLLKKQKRQSQRSKLQNSQNNYLQRSKSFSTTDKILLDSKLGYRNPQNLIRQSMIISLKL